jgi:hypothetical protein
VGRSDPPNPATQAKDIVAQCSFASLPLHLRNDLDSFHRETVFDPDHERQASWRAWLDGLGSGLKVGFAWRSSRSDRQARYFHPPIAVWRKLFSVPGITWIPMQYGNFLGELEALLIDEPNASVVRPELDLFNDLEGILALGASLDLMISTGTTAAYLPAAGGTETWLALTQRDYLMSIGAPECAWFPRASIYTGDRPNDWLNTAADIAHDLQIRADRYRR